MMKSEQPQQQQQQQEQQQQQQQQQQPPKKKFGKNLTKIVQSQQQVGSGGVPDTHRSSISSTPSSRNGLLLLSTNKKSSSGGSGLLTTSVDTPGGSTLFSSAGVATKESTPLDAWGVQSSSITGTSSNNNKNTLKTSATLGSLSALTSTATTALGSSIDTKNPSSNQNARQQQPQLQENQPDQNLATVPSSPPDNEHVGNQTVSTESHKDVITVPSTEASSKQEQLSNPPLASWDEYGGRGGSRESASEALKKVLLTSAQVSSSSDPDKEYMSSKAKERAAMIQKDEEHRIQEQRTRTAARLREMNLNQNQPKVVAATGSNNIESTITSSNMNDGAALKQSQESHQQQQQPVNSDGGMIHLNSYEDRDRGMSAQPNQPRMLFDPKSGAMVAVKAREEAPTPNKSSKKNCKKTQTQQENVRNTKTSSTRSNKDSNSSNVKIAKKGADGDNAAVVKVQLLKNANPVASSTSSYDATAGKVNKKPANASQQQASSTAAPVLPSRVRRSLPRTCGVLYKRHKPNSSKNNSQSGDDLTTASFYCVDGCEGDLGYGAHSVPGGRLRNPDAYTKYKQQQQPQQRTGNGTGFRSTANNKQQMQMNARMGNKNSSSAPTTSPSAFLYTGFNPSTMQQARDPAEEFYDDEDDNDHDFQHRHLDWVTAEDKLELVGMDEDEQPTLKPTAKAFAPSKAALAAAATLRTQDSMGGSVDGDDDDDNNTDFYANNAMGVLGLDDDLGADDDDYDDYDDEEIDEHHHQTVNRAALDILNDDDDDDVNDNINNNGSRHHHHLILHPTGGDSDVIVDPLGIGLTGDIHELMQKTSKKKSDTSRLVRLEEEPPLDHHHPSLLGVASSFASPLTKDTNKSNVLGGSNGILQNSDSTAAVRTAFNPTPGHTIFGFGSSSLWDTGTSSVNASSTGHHQAVTNTTKVDWEVENILNLGLGTAAVGDVGLGSTARTNSTGGLFNLGASESAFGVGVTGLVGGIPSSSSTTWATTGVVTSAFEGLTLNHGVLHGGVTGSKSSGKGGD